MLFIQLTICVTVIHAVISCKELCVLIILIFMYMCTIATLLSIDLSIDIHMLSKGTACMMKVAETNTKYVTTYIYIYIQLGDILKKLNSSICIHRCAGKYVYSHADNIKKFSTTNVSPVEKMSYIHILCMDSLIYIFQVHTHSFYIQECQKLRI